MSFSAVSFAQEKKAEKKAAAKKKPAPKATKQEWGNWSKSGDKTLDDKAKKDAAKAKK